MLLLRVNQLNYHQLSRDDEVIIFVEIIKINLILLKETYLLNNIMVARSFLNLA